MNGPFALFANLLTLGPALAAPLELSPAWVVEGSGECSRQPQPGRGADLDGDGLSELGLTWYGCEDGVYRIWRGTTGDLSSSPDLTIEPSEVHGAYFALGNSMEGDIDGDGTPDLVLATYATLTDSLLSVYLGESGDIPSVVSQEISSSALGLGMDLAVGDFDADGYDDVAAGANASASYAGEVQVFMGSSEGLEDSPSRDYFGSEARISLGYALDVGDIDADGYDDLVAGAYGATGGQGLLEVFMGSADGLSRGPIQNLEGEDGDTGLGAALRLGDVNGDGYEDVVVSALYESVALGEVRLHLGSADGLSSEPDQVLVPDLTGSALFGYNLEVADFDQDGYADLAVTAFTPLRAWIYAGSSAGFVDAPEELEPDSSNFAWNLANVGDVNGDGLPDLILTGERQAALYLGHRDEVEDSGDTGDTGETGASDETGASGESGDTASPTESAAPEESAEPADSDTGVSGSPEAADTADGADKSSGACSCTAASGPANALVPAALAGLALLRRRPRSTQPSSARSEPRPPCRTAGA